MVKQRIEYIDFIKGICIFLVVWAHTVQNMGGPDNFWDNPVHVFICSFHMPIFMVVSGFFFSKSLNDSWLQSTKKRFVRLIVPCFGWSLVLVALSIGYQLYNGNTLSPVAEVKTLLYETGTRFWFLRSVFICFVLATISMKVFKKDWVAFLLSFIVFMLLPDNGRLHLDKFMYPFFWAGYFLHKYIELVMKNRTWLLIASCIGFVVLLVFWTKDCYIYRTGMALYELKGSRISAYPFSPLIFIIVYRYLIGFVGSLFIFLLLQRLYRPEYKWIEKIGTYTLGIYTIHIIIEGNLLAQFNLSFLNMEIYNFIVTPLISIVLIIICVGIIRLLETNKYTKVLFLGQPGANVPKK